MSYRSFKSLDLPAIDKEIRAFWQKEGIFEKSIVPEGREESYVFYEGPPSANGKPGIHHVISGPSKIYFAVTIRCWVSKYCVKEGGTPTDCP